MSPPPIDIDHLRRWLGRSQSDTDVLDLRHARLMAATVGLAPEAIAPGAPLPPLWHWLWFLAGEPPAGLGRDGHPARGGFLPPVPLPNRMWAGGHVEFLAALPIGASATRTSTIESVSHKAGRSGELVFVAVRHEVAVAGTVCVRERQDLVYRDPGPAKAVADGAPGAGREMAQTLPSEQAAPASAAQGPWESAYLPTSTMLFRYSALTFNGHRIHYDQDYCRRVEGYANLVVHGPLNATMLCAHAAAIAGRAPRVFEYRGLRPALLGTAIRLRARHAEPDQIRPAGGEDAAATLVLEALLDDGGVCMAAQAVFDTPI